MKSKILLTIILIFNIGCSYNYYNYTNDKQKDFKWYKIQIENVDLKLTNNDFNSYGHPDYPNEKDLHEIFKNNIIDKLKSMALYAESGQSEKVLIADLKIEYKRTFSIIHNSYVGSYINYMITLRDKDEIVATRNLLNTNYFASRGLIGNFVKIAKTIIGKYNQQDELAEIKIFTDGISDDFVHLGK